MTVHLVQLLAWTWSGVVWTILSIIVFVVCLVLIGVILIQDSKDGGLGGAFGGAGGGSALLGARMQRDLARITAFTAGILGVCVVTMALLSSGETSESVAGASKVPEPAPAESSGATGVTPAETGVPPILEVPEKEAKPEGASGAAPSGTGNTSAGGVAAPQGTPAPPEAPEKGESK